MNERTPFGEWLRQRRHLLNLTQSALASQSGCSAVTIRKLESGDRKPSIELAQSLAVALRIPERERAALVQFAWADGLEASNPLPAWEPEQVTWRGDQLPDHRAAPVIPHTGLTIHYDLVGPEPPKYEKVGDGRFIAKVEGTGSITGDIEGTMDIQITQIIQPKPKGIGYSQALPMQIGVLFTIRSGVEVIKGMYTGSLTPTLNDKGNGHALVKGTGQVISVTAAFADLFLNFVFVEDVVRMREGTGTGARGTMQLKPAV